MLRAFSVLALTTLVASLAWGILAQRIYFMHTNREPVGWGTFFCLPPTPFDIR